MSVICSDGNCLYKIFAKWFVCHTVGGAAGSIRARFEQMGKQDEVLVTCCECCMCYQGVLCLDRMKLNVLERKNVGKKREKERKK